ncbi:hypothetical protein PHISP_06595, partial [Aspergillus sp. HF37]
PSVSPTSTSGKIPGRNRRRCFRRFRPRPAWRSGGGGRRPRRRSAGRRRRGWILRAFLVVLPVGIPGSRGLGLRCGWD